MASIIHAVAHGLIADEAFQFANVLPTDCGIDENTTYYVLAAGLTADQFEFSTSVGGTPFVLTSAITDGSLVGLDVYDIVADGVMDQPTAPAAPGSCVLTSAVTIAPDGTAITRLTITITQPTSATLRHTIVTVTGGSNTAKVVIPVGQTTGSIASVVPGVAYTGSAVAYDTFGLASSATVSAAHTAAGDTTAPSQVTGAAAFGAILGAIVTWTASTAADLAHYEVQVDTVNTFLTATTYRTKSNVFNEQQIAAGTYYFRIRAVDLSGNAGTYSSTVSATARTVQTADLTDALITTAKLVAGAVTDVELASAAVTAAKIAVDAVTAPAIAASAVGNSELAAGAVTAAKITAGTITSNEIAALTIVAANIAAGTIVAAKIAAGTITTNEIAALTIVAANIAASTITGAKIAAGTITASNIAADTITANEIAASAITSSELAAGSVTAAKIVAGTITATEIAANTITAAKIAADTITASEIAASAITSSELAAGAVIAGKITAGTIVAADMAAGAVTADKLRVGRNRNLVPNESFETNDGSTASKTTAAQIEANVPGWTAWQDPFTAGSVWTIGTSAVYHGTYRGGLQWGGTVSGVLAVMTDLIAVLPGRKYHVKGRIRGTGANVGAANGSIHVRAYAADGTTANSDTNVTGNTNVGTSTSWVEIEGDITLSASDHWVRVGLVNSASSAVNTFVGFDLIQFTLIDQQVTNSDGNVVIDSSGITITNGKLTFQDQFGTSAFDGGGFAASWLRFIVNRVYNGDFAVGSTSDIAVSETGSGSGTANYLASLSADLPYWVVAASGGTLAKIADATATGGFAIQSVPTAGAQTNRIYQDIPVVPGEFPVITRNWRVTRTANDVAVNIYASYRDSTHAIIGSRLGAGVTFSATISAYQAIEDTLGLAAAPANASYLRYEIEFVHNTGTGTTVWVSDINYRAATQYATPFASADLTLTTAYQDITGATATMEKGKTYLVIWNADFNMTVAGVGTMSCQIVVDGSAGALVAEMVAATATARGTVGAAVITATSPTGTGIIKLQAKKSINAGTAAVLAANTSLVIMQVR